MSAATEWRTYWFLPIAAALGYSTSVLHVYGLGPFFAPLQEEFGWSRAQISSGLSLATIISGLFCIPIGMLIDRVGPRVFGLIGALAMTGAFALLSTATGDAGNWLMLWGVIAIGTLFVQATVWTSAVASRFESSRGFAFAITLTGASVAQSVFPVLSAWLIENHGWRVGFWGMGAIWAALVFPVLLLCFRGAQDQTKAKVLAPVDKAALPGMSLIEGLRSRQLYILLLAAAMFSFTAIAIVVHFVPILTDRGASTLAAAGIASVVGFFSIIGRLGTGVLLDKFPPHLVAACAYLIPIPACVLLLFAGADPVAQILAAAIFGLTVGSEVDVIAYLASRYFGLKNFAALYGALSTALAVGIATGPYAAGAVYDNYGTYEPFLITTIALMGLSSIALLNLGRPPNFSAAH